MPKLLRIFMVLTLVSFSFVFAVSSATAAPGVTLTVNTTADGPDVNPGDGLCEANVGVGDCTLRAAIEETNANTNPTDTDVINFAIPGAGIHTIAPLSQLPDITEPLSVDGSSQGGVDCVNHETSIALDGSSSLLVVLKFNVGSDGSSVNGLSFTNTIFQGVEVDDIDGFEVTCSNFGVSADGITPGSSGGYGLNFENVNNISIGGASVSDGNLIENNGTGISIFGNSSNIDIENNIIKKSTMLSGIEIGNGGTFSNVLITNNEASDTNASNAWGAGITVDNVDGIVVTNNITNNNNGSTTGLGVQILNSKDVRFENNESNENGPPLSGGSRGFACYTCEDVVMLNNVLNNNGGEGSGFIDVARGNISGNRALGNGANGFLFEQSEQLDIVGNVTGNSGAGGINLADIVDSTVRGNFSGVDSDGLTPLGNGAASLILISNQAGHVSSNNVIGGTNIADRNYFANSGTGDIILAGLGGVVSGNRIIGNYSGININGEIDSNFENKAAGVIFVGAASNNILGGTNLGEANVVAGNTAGVWVISAFGLVPSNNSILGNSIYSNTSGLVAGLGIDLLEDTNFDFVPDFNVGVNPNDVGDVDAGPNNNLNYPIVSNVQTSNDDVAITYSVDVDNAKGVPAPSGYRIEFYANVAANPSGHGDGQIYLGFENISGPVSNHTFSIPNTGLPVGTYSFALTATQINSGTPFGFGSTSEYSGVEVAGITATQDIVTTTTTTTTTVPSATGNVSGNSDSKSASGVLSTTGTDSAPIALNALVIILVGSSFVFAAKRKRSRRSI